MPLNDAACLAVIPARGGSKRIPRKNVREFCGKPMIAWSIETARRSGLFSRVVVSTDSPEIAEVARSFGAEVPFVRPAELADDHATTAAVMQHAVRWSFDHWGDAPFACCIYATAPLLDADDLLKGLDMIRGGRWKYVFSATEFASPVYRSFRLDADGGLAMLFPEHMNTRSQDLPTVLHDAAQFYWGTAQAWLDRPPIFGGDSAAFKIPRSRVQDIDTPQDWEAAEKLFRLAATQGRSSDTPC